MRKNKKIVGGKLFGTQEGMKIKGKKLGKRRRQKSFESFRRKAFYGLCIYSKKDMGKKLLSGKTFKKNNEKFKIGRKTLEVYFFN